MITLAHLLSRRAHVAASKRRHRPRPVPAAAPPRGVVVAYAAVLAALFGELDAEVLAALRAEGLAPHHADAPADGDAPLPVLPAQVARVGQHVQAAADQLLARRGLLVALDDIAARTAVWSRDQWARQVKAVMGIDLPAGDPPMAAMIGGFRSRNVALIRSLTEAKVAKVHEVLTTLGSGTRVEEIMARIQVETATTPARAALIARDQVLTLNAEVTQARHVAAGVTEYTWSTSKDERVREGHKDLEGTRQKYTEPPVVDPKTGRRANAGQDFQCRCVAIPIIEGIDEP